MLLKTKISRHPTDLSDILQILALTPLTQYLYNTRYLITFLPRVVYSLISDILVVRGHYLMKL